MGSMKLVSVAVILLTVYTCTECTLPQREIRSLLSYLRSLRSESGDKSRFVGQLATDCGMNCDKRSGTEPQRPKEGSKRFMSLHAADCGSFECVLRKRMALEKVKRILMSKKEKASSTSVNRDVTRGRHKRFIDIVFGNPYDQPSDSHSQPWEQESNYGSYGWSDYYDNGPRYDYYGNDYDDEYDASGSASGSGYNDAEQDRED